MYAPFCRGAALTSSSFFRQCCFLLFCNRLFASLAAPASTAAISAQCCAQREAECCRQPIELCGAFEDEDLVLGRCKYYTQSAQPVLLALCTQTEALSLLQLSRSFAWQQCHAF